MLFFRHLLCFLCLSLLSLTAFAQETLTTTTTTSDNVLIVTPVPEPKEVVVAPQGYISCFNVEAGWYKGVWYPARKVCTYDVQKVTSAQGDAWIEGYWACTKFLSEEKLKGQCTNWEWKPGHWVKTLEVY